MALADREALLHSTAWRIVGIHMEAVASLDHSGEATTHKTAYTTHGQARTVAVIRATADATI